MTMMMTMMMMMMMMLAMMMMTHKQHVKTAVGTLAVHTIVITTRPYQTYEGYRQQ